MKIDGKQFHTIWLKKGNPAVVQVIDQRKLPFKVEISDLKTLEDTFLAIKEMKVRGAPLIGVTAAFGMYLGLLNFKKGDVDAFLKKSAEYLKSSRPTAVNLAFATDGIRSSAKEKNKEEATRIALNFALNLMQKEIEFGNKIGEAGLGLIQEIFNKTGRPVNILTHCNAGWLACIDWGTATAPVYKAHRAGIPVHVWVDETRPRNQGARLTAFELAEEGVPHTVIADNTGGHLMQHGLVDLVIVGSDRTTVTGDIANKIGTYLKALAAFDNNIPFYAALPSTSIDWDMEDGLAEIPIERRNPDEVAFVEGLGEEGISRIRIIPEKSDTANYAFDVTPARLITGLITERGICHADKKSILNLFPEKDE